MPPRISAQITVEEDVPAANFALAVDNLNTSVNVHVRGSNHGARHDDLGAPGPVSRPASEPDPQPAHDHAEDARRGLVDLDDAPVEPFGLARLSAIVQDGSPHAEFLRQLEQALLGDYVTSHVARRAARIANITLRRFNVQIRDEDVEAPHAINDADAVPDDNRHRIAEGQEVADEDELPSGSNTPYVYPSSPPAAFSPVQPAREEVLEAQHGIDLGDHANDDNAGHGMNHNNAAREEDDPVDLHISIADDYRNVYGYRHTRTEGRTDAQHRDGYTIGYRDGYRQALVNEEMIQHGLQLQENAGEEDNSGGEQHEEEAQIDENENENEEEEEEKREESEEDDNNNDKDGNSEDDDQGGNASGGGNHNNGSHGGGREPPSGNDEPDNGGFGPPISANRAFYLADDHPDHPVFGQRNNDEPDNGGFGPPISANRAFYCADDDPDHPVYGHLGNDETDNGGFGPPISANRAFYLADDHPNHPVFRQFSRSRNTASSGLFSVCKRGRGDEDAAPAHKRQRSNRTPAIFEPLITGRQTTNTPPAYIPPLGTRGRYGISSTSRSASRRARSPARKNSSRAVF